MSRHHDWEVRNAIFMAMQAHEGQTDKIGAAYIYHPLRVMGKMQNNTDRIIAVLHDVVEDTDVTLGLVCFVFGEEIAYAVDALTKRPGEQYIDYLDRVRANDRAIRVKLADIEDNMLEWRRELSPASEVRRKKYVFAVEYLTRWGEQP
jgi:(p)ppGpp synthase/HD superfamily hydrolase